MNSLFALPSHHPHPITRLTHLLKTLPLFPASASCSLTSLTFPNNAKWNYLSCVWHRGLACDVIWCVFVQSLPGKTVKVHLSRGNGDRSTKVCFHTAEPWGKWGARGPRDDCGLSGFSSASQTCFHKHQECVKKAQSKYLPHFFFFLWASIHHPPIRGGAQQSPASSSVWHGNTICSVSYCIHHCGMRELWETSTMSKNVTEDMKSWAGFQALLIFPSICLSVMKLSWITARPQTQPVTHLGRFIRSEHSASLFVWNDAVRRQLLKLSQQFVTRPERVNLMTRPRHISPFFFFSFLHYFHAN